MTITAGVIQKEVRKLAAQLPSNATWDDVIEEARFRKAVETGLAAAKRGAFATDQEVRAAFSKWGVKV